MIPTPGLAALVVQRAADAGVVISASHNPFKDNGIKFFSSSGYKLSDEEEGEIETHIEHHDLQSLAGDRFGYAEPLEGAVDDVRGRHRRPHPAGPARPAHRGRLRPRRHVRGGAAGPRAASARRSRCCARRRTACNINAGCGSTHIGALQEMVRADGFDLGLAFDGDGDRMLAVDASGELVDGDFIIAILARHLKAKGLLRHDTVVTTVMTNLGFHIAMQREGIKVDVTPVGRPLRRGRDAQGRLRPGRRAVRAHHQPGRGHDRRRPGERLPAAAGAARDGRAAGRGGGRHGRACHSGS